MQVEIFSICDAATDYGGRLNILGAFEGIAAAEKPIARNRCTIAVRMRFSRTEAGAHEACIRFLDKDGKQPAPDLRAKLQVNVGEGRESCAFNLVLNINRLVLPDFGSYRILLMVDGALEAELPLLVAAAKPPKQGRGRVMDN